MSMTLAMTLVASVLQEIRTDKTLQTKDLTLITNKNNTGSKDGQVNNILESSYSTLEPESSYTQTHETTSIRHHISLQVRPRNTAFTRLLAKQEA